MSEETSDQWVHVTIEREASRLFVHSYSAEENALIVDEVAADGSLQRVRTTSADEVRA